MAWQLPLIASAVSYVFAAVVAAQWVVRRKPHQLAWALGLAAYALASGIDAYVSANAWNAPLYRAYFVLAAGNVGLLGAGTMFLVRRRIGNAFLVFALVGMLVALFAPWELTLAPDQLITIGGEQVPLAEAGTELGGKAIPFSNPGRVAFLLLNIVGGLALIGGAAWSWWRTRKNGVLLIAIGALLPFLGGSASTFASIDARLLLQFLGVGVMFAGFLLGGRVSASVASASG